LLYTPHSVQSAGRLTDEVMLMPLAVSWMLLLAQGNAGGDGLFGGSFLIPFLVIGMLFYFLMIRPERRMRQEKDKMLDSLNKDDQIVTIGGLWGVVVNASKGSEYVTIRVDEGNGTKLRILRSAISRVITDTNPAGTKDGSA
jgi:preprotein translocase subunit YajC